MTFFKKRKNQNEEIKEVLIEESVEKEPEKIEIEDSPSVAEEEQPLTTEELLKMPVIIPDAIPEESLKVTELKEGDFFKNVSIKYHDNKLPEAQISQIEINEIKVEISETNSIELGSQVEKVETEAEEQAEKAEVETEAQAEKTEVEMAEVEAEEQAEKAEAEAEDQTEKTEVEIEAQVEKAEAEAEKTEADTDGQAEKAATETEEQAEKAEAEAENTEFYPMSEPELVDSYGIVEKEVDETENKGEPESSVANEEPETLIEENMTASDTQVENSYQLSEPELLDSYGIVEENEAVSESKLDEKDETQESDNKTIEENDDYDGPELRISSLFKSFGRKQVVRGVDFKMRTGEVLGLLGPNGAGKTTTFYMVVGFYKPTAGNVFLNNKCITKLPMYKRARLGISYLPQEPSVFRKFTVEENIWAVLETRHDLSRKQKKAKLEELIEEFAIGRIRKQKAYTLSGGERRRTEIARALAIEPKFLLLDEPFAGIDPIAVADIKGVIKILTKKGIGVLITDHNVRDTLEITDRAVIINNGTILLQGNKDDIMNSELAKEIYLGKNFKI